MNKIIWTVLAVIAVAVLVVIGCTTWMVEAMSV